jgi:hypothetical protein
MGVATKLPSVKVDGGRLAVGEDLIVGVYDRAVGTTSGVRDGVGEAICGGVNVIGGSRDNGVKGLGKANKTTLTAMIAITSNPSENRKSFQLREYLLLKGFSIEWDVL